MEYLTNGIENENLKSKWTEFYRKKTRTIALEWFNKEKNVLQQKLQCIPFGIRTIAEPLGVIKNSIQLKKIAINNLIKWGLIVSTISIIGCSVKRDFRNKTTSTKVKLNTLDLSLNYHVKQGNYIISIHDSIGKRLTEKFIFLQDSFAFKMDTIDLNLTNPYWTKRYIFMCSD